MKDRLVMLGMVLMMPLLLVIKLAVDGISRTVDNIID
jgi:hypothetical protein